MKLVVIGGTGLVGSQVVKKLTVAGHQAVPAAPETGVDLISGQGLDQALAGAEVVINVANSPTNSATKVATITWAGLANSTNYLYYRSNLLSTNWVQVFSTNQGPVNGTITVKRTNSAGFYRVQVNPSQP